MGDLEPVPPISAYSWSMTIGHDIEGGGGDFDVDNDHDEQLGQAETDDDDNDDDHNGYDEDENLVPGTLGPGGGGVNQAMQAATASKMSRMHT